MDKGCSRRKVRGSGSVPERAEVGADADNWWVQLGPARSITFLLALRSGARDIAVIAAPAESPDWIINVRPRSRASRSQGKFVATAALQVGESSSHGSKQHG